MIIFGGARSPEPAAGCALERTGDPVGDPAAVELARLGPDDLAVHRDPGDPPGVQRDMVGQGAVAGGRPRIEPRRGGHHQIAGDQVEIVGGAFELAERGARGGPQAAVDERDPGQVVGRRVAGLQDPQRGVGGGDPRLAQEHLDPLTGGVHRRRPGVVPHRFLPVLHRIGGGAGEQAHPAIVLARQ